MAAASRWATPRASRWSEVVAVDVNGAVGALGEGFANGGSDALGAGAEHDDFAAVLLFELEGFFEGVGVGLVHGELKVGFFDPFAGGVDADLRIALGDLFDGYDDFHSKMLHVHLNLRWSGGTVWRAERAR